MIEISVAQEFQVKSRGWILWIWHSDGIKNMANNKSKYYKHINYILRLYGHSSGMHISFSCITSNISPFLLLNTSIISTDSKQNNYQYQMTFDIEINGF